MNVVKGLIPCGKGRIIKNTQLTLKKVTDLKCNKGKYNFKEILKVFCEYFVKN